MCSPDFADFSDVLEGLATIFHHNWCVKSWLVGISACTTANLSILAAPLNRMLDCFGQTSRPRRVHAPLGKLAIVCRFRATRCGLPKRSACFQGRKKG